MKARILLVDDEPNVLSSLKRQLRSNYEVETETDPCQALVKLKTSRPYAAIISDYRMPEMNGIEFLQRVKKLKPDSTRLMLTGYADLENAMKAVNEGHVFRFLTKPCEPGILQQNLKEAVGQYELVTGKRILLERTLKGSVELLSEITSLVNPEASARINRVRRYVRFLAKKKGVKDLWRYDIATMLSQLGTLILPPDTVDLQLQGEKFNMEQEQLFEMHPAIAKNLVAKLPRMESIADMIEYQLKGFDGSGTPRNAISGEKIPLGGRILKIALDYDLHLYIEQNAGKAFAKLEADIDQYDPELLYYLEGMLGVEARYEVRKVTKAELIPGMILYEDIHSDQGALLLRKSLELDKDKIDRINMFAEKVGIPELIHVLVPS